MSDDGTEPASTAPAPEPGDESRDFERASLLLHRLADRAGDTTIALGSLADDFGRRAFGLLTFFASLPCFIPAPGGVGVVSGAVLILLGLQMLVGREQPWLPQRWRRHGISGTTLKRWLVRAERWFVRLERVTGPRWPRMHSRGAQRMSGLLLSGLAIAIALPIPFTNYPFGLVAVIYALALIEEDGLLLLGAWLLAAVVIAASSEALQRFIGWLLGWLA